uniref:Uncharacterized protein n=1 Tax=Arundo donax TaxID=35708 RepID=A0A0A9HN96_ARUDO
MCSLPVSLFLGATIFNRLLFLFSISSFLTLVASHL